MKKYYEQPEFEYFTLSFESMLLSDDEEDRLKVEYDDDGNPINIDDY